MKNINQELLEAAKRMLAADPSSIGEQAEAAAALYAAIRNKRFPSLEQIRKGAQ